MEFFQAAALLHDDVMDDSAVRAASGSRPLRRSACAARVLGSSSRFGEAAAILAGDLRLVWTDE